MGIEGGGNCRKTDSKEKECVQFGESAVACSSIDSITEIKCWENSHFDKGEFRRGSEGVAVAVKETVFGPYLRLQPGDVT